MAANAPPELPSGNSCCLAWQGKYIGMKKRRDACKEAIQILQKAMGAANDEKSNLQNKLREMADNREAKENDSVAKASLEKEVFELKSEIFCLQQRLERNLQNKSEEVEFLKSSSVEKEINELKSLLKKETFRANNSEEEREQICKELNRTKALLVKYDDIKPHVPEVEKEISLVKNLLASERHKTESERKRAESEKKKADQYLSELVVLRATAQKTSSDFLAVTSSIETVKKQLESEKQKTLKERKRADTESAKAKEQMKLAEDLCNKIEIIRARNEELKKEAELQTASSKVKFAENSAELEEKKRLLEINKKEAIAWKSRADTLTQQLRDAKLVTEGLKRHVLELLPSQRSAETCSVSPDKVRDLEKAKVRLLKKELKFMKKCAKHSKEVAEFERFRREFQAEEIGRLRLEFGSLTNRMNLLDRLSRGTSGRAKVEDRMKLQMVQSLSGEKHSDARCQLVASSGSQEQARKLSTQLIAKSRQGVYESVSGTISQLESPNGGSRESQTSGEISSATSCSDGQFLTSEGAQQFSVTTSAETSNDEAHIQPAKSTMFQKINLVADNTLQECQRDNHEVVNEHPRKRKRMPEIVESRKHQSPGDTQKNLQLREKLGTSQSLEEKENLVLDMQGGSSANCTKFSKERRVSCEKKTVMRNSLELNRPAKTQVNKAGSTQVAWNPMCLSTAKGHAAAALFLEDIASTDVMKLLELEKPEDENHYKMAVESLLSPDLPQVDFLDGLIVNEDKNPTSALDLVARDSMELCDTINSSEDSNSSTHNASVTNKMSPMSTVHGGILKHFVVFSNIEDQNSIIKIFHAANSCIQRYPSVTKAEWAVPAILFSLKMEENLMARDRVCVFLSLLLHNFSVVSSMKIGNILDDDSCSCLDSFSKHISSVIADTEARGILSEFLEEFLSLLQDLLSEQRVLFCVKFSETSESDLSIPVTLNGENVALVSKMALVDHLVAGSALLAAICSGVDRVGFIREVSFDILHKHCHEKTSVPLTILHVFAHIAGEKMMSSSDHDISIAVLKSIVMFLEKRHFGSGEGNIYLHSGKNKCLFSDKSSSLEAMASMLMEIIQEFTQSNTFLHQSLTEKVSFRPAHKDFQCVLVRDQSVALSDVMSLVELVTCYTAWDWTNANIVAPLLKMLGTPLSTNLYVAIVSLLGQLSSIGVDAGGYENEGISNVREKLSAFLESETTLKAGFVVQIANVSSLLKTLQLDFSIVFQGKTTMLPCCGDQSSSASANLVIKWFSLLSQEQRVFTTEFFLGSCC
ncbi:Maternal effect embryo arrest 22 [Hirschfeldia incana]|nr:Maternal effect embryo arrest 22 [Hirschfeldia incana]